MLIGGWLGCGSLVAGWVDFWKFIWLVGWLDSFGWQFSASLSLIRFILIASLVRDQVNGTGESFPGDQRKVG